MDDDAGRLRDEIGRLQAEIANVLPTVARSLGGGLGARAQLDAALTQLVALEVHRATNSITLNLIALSEKIGYLANVTRGQSEGLLTEMGNLTKAITSGGAALNSTSEAGNLLNRRIGWLTFVGRIGRYRHCRADGRTDRHRREGALTTISG